MQLMPSLLPPHLSKQKYYGPPVRHSLMDLRAFLASFYFCFLNLIQSQIRNTPVIAIKLCPIIIEDFSNMKIIIYTRKQQNQDITHECDQTVIFYQQQYKSKLIIKMGNCQAQSNEIDQNQPGYQRAGKTKFNPFFQPNSQNNEEQAILSQYNFHSNYDDKFLGRCSILQHKQTKNFYLSKQILTNSAADYDKKKQEFIQIQRKLSFENIIQIKHIIEKQADGFFVQSKKLIVIVDYPLTNMQKQLNSRLVNKLEFTRQQIINVLISCIKGYALIERERTNDSQIFKNDKIRLKNIFFGIKNRDTLIKVAQSSILNEESNLQSIFNDQHNVASNRDIYLAPEQFQAYIKRDSRRDFQRAGVFSFGMSVLDLCIMTSSRQAYHYDQKIMDFNQIRNRVLIAGKRYGAIVQRFLGDMLQVNDRKRLSFDQLQAKIPSLLISRNEGEASRMNLSVARSNSLYLRNNPRNIRESTSRSRDSIRSRSNSRGSVNRGNISSNYSNMSINSRYNSKLGKRMRGEKQDNDQLDRVHEIYDKSIGRQYIGQKKGNAKHGQGKYQFQKGGSFYQGQWRNNKMQGKGQTYFRQGQLQYSGQWKSDQYHGWGLLYTNPQLNSKWISFQGEFKNGVKEGRGQMKFRNGVTYDGQFRGDKIHGRGKVIKDGKIINDGYWQLANPETFLRENNLEN